MQAKLETNKRVQPALVPPALVRRNKLVYTDLD